MDRVLRNRITGIAVHLTTAQQHGGTYDPLYLGIICSGGSLDNRSGREFPLRHKKRDTKLENGSSYTFGFGTVDSSYEPAWDATGAGKNGLEYYPLRTDNLSRVYTRKEPKKAGEDADDALIIDTIDVMFWAADQISDMERARHFGNVYLDALQVPLHLGNEFGACVDLFSRDT